MSNFEFGKVMVLGASGMVGSAVIRQLEGDRCASEVIAVSRKQVDLTNQQETFRFIAAENPEWLVVAAAKVGGIRANSEFPKDFIYENLAIELNAIEGAFRGGVSKLIFLGSSCIYPKYSVQPMMESELLTGPLEPTNEPYAIAKIAGIKLCEAYNRQCGTDYRSLMPTNLYGPGDNYNPAGSHVIPGLIGRFHKARMAGSSVVEVWGSGSARREFLHVDDLASAILHLMRTPKDKMDELVTATCSHLNVGTGEELNIAELAELVKSVTSFEGRIIFDKSVPDGAPRKLMDSGKIRALGWSPRIGISEGLVGAYGDFVSRFL